MSVYNQNSQKLIDNSKAPEEAGQKELGKFVDLKLQEIREFAADWFTQVAISTHRFCLGYTEQVCGDLPSYLDKNEVSAASDLCKSPKHSIPTVIRSEPTPMGSVTIYEVACYQTM
jgi:hypothetical protein